MPIIMLENYYTNAATKVNYCWICGSWSEPYIEMWLLKWRLQLAIFSGSVGYIAANCAGYDCIDYSCISYGCITFDCIVLVALVVVEGVATFEA